MKFTTGWSVNSRKMSEAVITDEKRLLFALGLCARARKITVGVPMICDAMRSGGKNAPRLVFEASDTSENTHKRLSDKCAFYSTRHVRLTADGDTLAKTVGKSSAIAAVAIADAELCRLAEQYLRFGQSDQV